MNAIELAQLLKIPPETIKAVQSYEMEAERERALKTLFYEDFQAFKAEVSREEDANLAVLYLYLRFASDTREKYRSLGAEERICLDSVKDIAIWADDYYVKTGRHGLREWGWVQLLLKLKVIRIGRLEFESTQMQEAAEVNGKRVSKGEDVLGVHIPAGEKLCPDAVREAFLRAPAFFKRHFGKEYKTYICGSWLLSPELEKLLAPGSAILAFQKYFTIYDVKPSRQAEERVFLCVSDDFETYPENTSLQKNLKRHLLNGGKVPSGTGIGFFDDIR